MTLVSKERLVAEKEITGYRFDIIEKVLWLMEILNAVASDPFLSDKIVLKGGTALNLF